MSFSKKTVTISSLIVSLILVATFSLLVLNTKPPVDSKPDMNTQTTSEVTKPELTNKDLCIPESIGTELEYQQNNLYSCIYDLLLTSLDPSNFTFDYVSSELDEYAREDGIFSNICHLASHDAGSFYSKETTPVNALKLTTNFCSSGFVHGVFDFLGAVDYPRSEWEVIARTCEEVSSIRPMACADGLGHASWDFYKNPEEAFTSCEIFTKPEKVAECAEGVVMQTYAPAVLKPASKVLEKPEDLEIICKDLVNDSLATGCFFGVGWLLANDIAIETAPHLAQRSYPTAQYDSLLLVFKKGIDSCLNLEKGASDCLGRFYTSIPYPVWRDVELKEFLCSSNKLITESCLIAANSIAG